MSISALSSNLITDLSQQQRQNPFQQMRQDFSQLASALQSGDLSTAQSAYSNLEQLLQARQSGPTSNSGSTPATTIQNDFASVGQALQSGSIDQAQTAFSQMQKDLLAFRQTPSAAPPAEDQYVPSTSQQQALSLTQQVQQDFAQLSKSLQSGDLNGAQSAFASLQQALQIQGAITQGPPVQTPPILTTAILSTPTPVQTPVQTTPIVSTPLLSTSVPSTPIPSTPTPSAPVQTTPIQSAPILSTQSTTNSASDTITNDFNALGSALSSGNLTQAQSAFSQLQDDIQTAQKAAGSTGQSLTQGLSQIVKGHHHHHHHGGGGESSTASSTSTSDSTDSSSNGSLAATNNITINIYA